MTAAVLSLAAAREKREPHLHGEARCAACGHVWQAVAPVGAHELECPECGSAKGHFTGSALRGAERFVCDCGCDVFRISAVHGPYCINCAIPAQGWF